ncbi:globin family protein, partial [Hyalangium rubrum]
MFDPKQPAPPPNAPNPSSTVSYGAGAVPVPAGQRPAAQPNAPVAAKGGLNPRSVELVQRSWAQVAPISDAASNLFYDRLFELDPSVRPLFKSDLAQQKKKLMQMLSVAVDGLSNPQRLVPVLEQLGARHAGYMVQEHHYGLVGEALLWTLREGLGESFTPETEAAWKEVYGLVATVMKKAAASGAAKAAPPVPAAATERPGPPVPTAARPPMPVAAPAAQAAPPPPPASSAPPAPRPTAQPAPPAPA